MRRLALACLVGLLLGPVAPAWGAITFVQRVGGANNKTAAGTNLSITAPAGGVAAGSTVVVAIAFDEASGTVSCADDQGNTYTVDTDGSQGSATAGVRSVQLSAHNITALTSGQGIGCAIPATAAKAMVAIEVSGLTASPKDTTATGNDTNNDPLSTSTGTLAQADEIAVGSLGYEGVRTLTVDADWTSVAKEGTSGGADLTNIEVHIIYRIVAATTALTFNDSTANALSASADWVAGLTTYKGTGAAAVIDFYKRRILRY